MSTAKRQPQSSVIQCLLDEPYRFEFVQALRIIETWLRRNGVAHDDALVQYVRFRSSLSMGFPPSQIEALVPVAALPVDSDQALQKALDEGKLEYISITPAFMGFFGINGCMPNHYTDGIADQVYSKKFEGSRAYFDVFLTRFMLLQYQAWAKYRVQYRFDDGRKAAILPLQLALAGAHPRSQTKSVDDETHAEIVDEVLAHYAAVLRQRPASALLIQGILAEYFGVPVRVEQFVGTWDVLEEKDLCKLGRPSATLGGGATLGKRSRQRNRMVRLHIGPLAMADYEKFLPGASGSKALTKMLKLFSTLGIDHEMNLFLRASDVRPISLTGPNGARLGLTSFLVTKPQTKDCGVVFALPLSTPNGVPPNK